jgi:hypothetical protein
LGWDVETMFVDWPDYKKQLDRRLQDALRARIRARTPLTQSVRHITLGEGEFIRVEMPSGATTEIVPQEHVERVEYRREMLRRNPAVTGQAMDDLASRMAENMEREMMETVRRSIESNSGIAAAFRGDSVRELGESLLEALRSVDVTFDEDGAPSVAFIPGAGGMEQLAALDESEDLRKRFDDIIEEKRRDWNLRENRRRLVN